MRVFSLWSLAIFLAGTTSLKTEQKRVTDIPTGNINAATNRYIVEVDKVCYTMMIFLLSFSISS
jgi:hypothetical protein